MNVPILRFNNFNKPWKDVQLNELMTFNNGINAPKESYGHGRKFINVLDILNNNYIQYEDIIGSVKVNEKQEGTSKVEYGDMLFLRSSETRIDVGKSSVYLDKKNFALFGGFVIRGKKMNDYIPYFLKLLLDTSDVRNQISSRAGGSTRYNVGQSILSSVNILMPTLEEQTKIADFFTLLDRRIEKQQKKVEAWREYKKSNMQKLLNQELRFRDNNGKEFPAWEEEQLKDLGIFLKGGGLAKKDLTVKGVPCILYGELYTIYEDVIREVNSLTDTNDKVVVGNKNDVLIPSSGETAIDIACASSLEVNNVLLGGDINIFRPAKNVLGSFISYQINSIKKKELAIYAQGSSVVHLYNNEIKKLKVLLPSYNEQKKISEFLSLIDEKIIFEEEKNRLLKKEKKSFMQQMFI